MVRAVLDCRHHVSLLYMHDRNSLWAIKDPSLEGLQESDATYWTRHVATEASGAEVTVDASFLWDTSGNGLNRVHLRLRWEAKGR